ncbi:unknown similar to AMEV013 [Choristoneura rosaceana entomopoxvirus 'L']|uniref:RING-type domain-containing protein n=1 Tax=Choristoneura rosaceana entomopoxvirus 'L' TaxID=1293539 RepID=A0ABM9QK85_9POXV|nr:unknown similar to AMEV013 [Choristoneura rosaceana entomopoxvirus 'L']CCU55944.1 unknown similar to AMEV013 [Choristoneura rosaceana entomopoxvirus 'L']
MISLMSISNNKIITCNSILLNIFPFFEIINNNKKYNYMLSGYNYNIQDDILLYKDCKFITKIYEKINNRIKHKNSSSITVKDFIEMYYIFNNFMIGNNKKLNIKNYPSWVINNNNNKCICCYQINNNLYFKICINCNLITCYECLLRCPKHIISDYYCINCCITDKYNIYCSECLVKDNYNLKKYNTFNNNNNNILPIQYSIGNTHINIIKYNKDKYYNYMNYILYKLYEEYEYIVENRNMEIKPFIKNFIKKFYPDIVIKDIYKSLDYDAESLHYISMEYSVLLYNKYIKIYKKMDEYYN